MGPSYGRGGWRLHQRVCGQGKGPAARLQREADVIGLKAAEMSPGMGTPRGSTEEKRLRGSVCRWIRMM